MIDSISYKYKQALNLIQNSHYILIVTHINPDADTISCALALSNYFSETKIKHKVFNKMKILPRNLDFLARFDKITDQLPKFYDLVIYVDCANKNSINIDHHQSNNHFAIINIVQSDKASSAEVLYEFFETNNLTVSKQTAQCLYSGIYDDSLKFSTHRCNADTFKIANELVILGVDPSYVADNLNQRDSLAKYRLLPKILDTLELHFEGKVASIYVLNDWFKQTGADYRECENIIDMILNIAIVDIAMFFRVTSEGTRVSLRSKNNIDVSHIAQNFHDGGHKMSAGCICYTNNIFEAKDMILNYIKGKDFNGKK
jgi:phosphoesterase RecJ-like protein